MEVPYYDAYNAAVYAAASSGAHQAPAEDEDGEDWDENDGKYSKKGNVLPFWGNQGSMNLNPLILTNIQNSPYFKVNLVELKVTCKYLSIFDSHKESSFRLITKSLTKSTTKLPIWSLGKKARGKLRVKRECAGASAV